MESIVNFARELHVRFSAPAPTRSEEGASATEYAVIVAIVVGALVALGAIFGNVLTELWQGMVDTIRTNFL